MIVFDTETTGLVGSSLLPENKQPKIIDLYAVKIDDVTLDFIEELELLIDPLESITDEIYGITGINTFMVKGQGSFASHLPEISKFWLGEKVDVGHNVNFDLDILKAELRRLGKLYNFPWCSTHFCTVELTEHYVSRRLKLIDLYEYLFGERFEGAHRAKADVDATLRCLREISKRGDLPKF